MNLSKLSNNSIAIAILVGMTGTNWLLFFVHFNYELIKKLRKNEKLIYVYVRCTNILWFQRMFSFITIESTIFTVFLLNLLRITKECDLMNFSFAWLDFCNVISDNFHKLLELHPFNLFVIIQSNFWKKKSRAQFNSVDFVKKCINIWNELQTIRPW